MFKDKEILVKTPWNGANLRLNARLTETYGKTVWLVTLPFQEPWLISREQGRWKCAGQVPTDPELIEAIGAAIDAQLIGAP